MIAETLIPLKRCRYEASAGDHLPALMMAGEKGRAGKMRKIKKINGYLVVRFNDREKRGYPQMGSYGVIDAELYSGNLMVDLDAMDYTDAETVEIAVEQARGLDSEFDMEEPEVKVTVVKDVDGKTSEETYDPVKMFGITRTLLEGDIQRGVGEDVAPRTAAHELRGFAKALMTMGAVRGDDERFYVPLDSFGTPPEDTPLTAGELREMIGQWVWVKVKYSLSTYDGWAFVCGPESLAFFEQTLSISENGTKFTAYRRAQGNGKPMPPCLRQPPEAAAADPPTLTPQEVRALRNLQGLLKEVEDYISGDRAAAPEGETATSYQPYNKKPELAVLRLDMDLSKIRTMQNLQNVLKLADSTPGAEPPRDQFQRTPEIEDDLLPRKIFQLGLAMEAGCPENDCTVYRNIFRMARELDQALDGAQGYAAEVLRREMGKHLRDLRRMYYINHAVKAFRKEASL